MSAKLLPCASLADNVGATPAGSGHSMPNAGIVPGQRLLVRRAVKLGALVQKIRDSRRHQDAVRQARAAPTACADSRPTARCPTTRRSSASCGADRPRRRIRCRRRTAPACPGRAAVCRCSPRKVHCPERLWLSCTNSALMPAAANFSICQVSMKKPRASPNTCGSINMTPCDGSCAEFHGRRSVR